MKNLLLLTAVFLAGILSFAFIGETEKFKTSSKDKVGVIICGAGLDGF